jgi:hypothetical protein
MWNESSGGALSIAQQFVCRTDTAPIAHDFLPACVHGESMALKFDGDVGIKKPPSL